MTGHAIIMNDGMRLAVSHRFITLMIMMVV